MTAIDNREPAKESRQKKAGPRCCDPAMAVATLKTEFQVLAVVIGEPAKTCEFKTCT